MPGPCLTHPRKQSPDVENDKAKRLPINTPPPRQFDIKNTIVGRSHNPLPHNTRAKPATRLPISTTNPKDRDASTPGDAQLLLLLRPSPPASPVWMTSVASLVAEATVEVGIPVVKVVLGLDGFSAPQGLFCRQSDEPGRLRRCQYRDSVQAATRRSGRGQQRTLVVGYAAVEDALVAPLLADEKG